MILFNLYWLRVFLEVEDVRIEKSYTIVLVCIGVEYVRIKNRSVHMSLIIYIISSIYFLKKGREKATLGIAENI